jgi:DNA-dependent RNA polymerase auxiliary subunit epsilon
MKYLFIAVIMMSLLFAQEKKKPVPKQVQDTTSLWLKKENIVNYLNQRRQQLKENYIVEDSKLQGQLEFIDAVSQDSLKIKR